MGFDAHNITKTPTIVSLIDSFILTHKSRGLFAEMHRRELFQNIQFPYDFNRDAHCPNWDLFLESLEFDPDTLSRLQEWAGYCLLPMVYGNLQKSLFFIGEGANGKSVFLETLAAVLDNVSHLELSELFDRFKIAELEGKLANICTDVETTKVMDARFKKIVAYGLYSPFNSYTTTPPKIYKNSVLVGYLTTNSYISPCFYYFCLTARIDPRSLILYKNSFY